MAAGHRHCKEEGAGAASRAAAARCVLPIAASN
jgi:hypothetical protein